jgi:hypothetical protein
VEGEVVHVSPPWDLAQESLKGGAGDSPRLTHPVCGRKAPRLTHPVCDMKAPSLTHPVRGRKAPRLTHHVCGM